MGLISTATASCLVLDEGSLNKNFNKNTPKKY
jgi:hypothetical protein